MNPAASIVVLIVVLAAGGAGWTIARWLHLETRFSAWPQIVASATVIALTLLLVALSPVMLVLLLALPVLALAGGLAASAWTYRRRAIGAAGALRQRELSRTLSLREALDERSDELRNDHRTRIEAAGGELQIERPIRFTTVALDDDGQLQVAAQAGRHVLSVGRTGEGKTQSIIRLLHARAMSGAAVIAIDPKPDPALLTFLVRLAATQRTPFYLVDPMHPGAIAYNPLAGGKTASQAADVALAGHDFSEAHYRAGIGVHLDHVARVLHAAYGGVSMPMLTKWAAIDDDAREALRTLAEGTEFEKQAAAYDVELNNTTMRSAVAASVLRMMSVTSRSWKPALTPDEDGCALDLTAAIKERAIILMRPCEAYGKEEAPLIAATMLADLTASCEKLDQDRDDWVCFVDEVSAVLNPQGVRQLVGLVQRSRSAGGQMVIGTQSVSDLAAFGDGPAFVESLAENFATVIAHQQQSQQSREWLSMLMGTREVAQQTERTAGHGMRADGTGSSRRAAEFRVPPDTFARLQVGEAVVHTAPAHPAQGQVRMIRPHSQVIEEISDPGDALRPVTTRDPADEMDPPDMQPSAELEDAPDPHDERLEERDPDEPANELDPVREDPDGQLRL